MPPIVTLTTDFEEREPYVASAKGVLCTHCPGVQIVDLSHQIPRDNVREGSLFLAGAAPYFPKGTVHIAAVSSSPRPIVVSVNDHYVVCPDNGVITMLAERYPIREVRAITNPELNLSGGGQTYYGRDVFSPAAAQLAAGAPFESMGDTVDDFVRLKLPKPTRESNAIVAGEIMHVNRFGSLVSNIHRADLEGSRVKDVEVGLFSVGPLSEKYADVGAGLPVALYGSAGYLEIAYNGDSAERRLNMGLGIIVKVTVEPAAAN